MIIRDADACAELVGNSVRNQRGEPVGAERTLSAFGKGGEGEALLVLVVDEFKAADVAAIDHADARFFVRVALMANLKATGGTHPWSHHGCWSKQPRYTRPLA